MDNFVNFEDFTQVRSVYCLTLLGNYFEFKLLPVGVSLKYITEDSPRQESKSFEDVSQCLEYIDNLMSKDYWGERFSIKRVGERSSIIDKIIRSPL